MMDVLLKDLVSQGGFAALAGLVCFLLYKMDQARVADQQSHIADLKTNHERERELARQVIEVLVDNTAAITNLAGEIASLRGSRKGGSAQPGLAGTPQGGLR